MGTSSSRHEDLSVNEYLQRFASKEHISTNDPFWNRFLSFTFTPPLTINDSIAFEARIAPICSHLVVNNLVSGNLGSLLQVFLSRANELLTSAQTENQMFSWQTYNALFILRSVSKYIIENVSEDEINKQFEARPAVKDGMKRDEDHSNRVEVFLDSLIEILVDVPVKDFTYQLHTETVSCVLVLLSVALYSGKPVTGSGIYRSLMHGRYAIHSPLLVKTLLQHFVNQTKAPPGAGSGSIVLGIASDIWNLLTFGYSRGTTPTHASEKALEITPSQAPLANQSCLLLLVLANHCTADKSMNNPYREALFSFTNLQEESPPSTSPTVFRLDFAALYATLCRHAAVSEHATLLLYLLVHRNRNVRSFLLARADVELLIVPVLETLYRAPDSNSHHIYMSLIVLLILSEDDLFNKMVHDTTLKSVSWYTERSISEISLGGLLVLVVIRTIQYNMLRMRDKYLHTNCLAALANMSGQFRALHPYVSQRLVSLFETIAKKHARLVDQIQQETAGQSAVVSMEDVEPSDLAQDLAVLEEVLRMVLEILNSCLSNQLAHNPNLVYTVLYKRDVFEPFRNHDAFQDIVQNIDAVISYFSYKLEKVDQDLSVSEVLATIQQGALQWPRERLKKFPDLKFKYVEEDQPEDFFIPYVWSLVCQLSGIYWKPESIKLFVPDGGTVLC